MEQMSFIQVERRSEYRPKVRDLPVRERPVSRLREVGPTAVSTIELLACLLQTPDALRQAQELLARFEGLDGLARACESEIVAGYFIEHSGMKFGLFFMGEWVEVVVISGLITAMFLGGWSIPYLPDAVLIGFLAQFVGSDLANVLAMVVHVASFFLKVIFLIFFQQLIRWSLPRFRYDQVMTLGWKILLPLSLANIVLTGLGILIVREIMS